LDLLVELRRVNPNLRVRIMAKLEGNNPGGEIRKVLVQRKYRIIPNGCGIASWRHTISLEIPSRTPIIRYKQTFLKGAIMGWGRTFLLGDVGNRLDISDCEADIRVLKESLMEIHQEEQAKDTELMTLKRENDDLKLYIASIIRLLTNKGLLTREEIEKMVDIIDAEDGALDGKARGDIL
jgi:hypothetical protein